MSSTRAAFSLSQSGCKFPCYICQLCSIILFYFFVHLTLGRLRPPPPPPTPPLPVSLRPPISQYFFYPTESPQTSVSHGGSPQYGDVIPPEWCLRWGGTPHGRRNPRRILSSIGGRVPPVSDGNFLRDSPTSFLKRLFKKCLAAVYDGKQTQPS